MAVSRREQLLSRAADLFATRGFHGVSVHDLGAACGVSGPALYRHFASKRDLYLAVLEESWSRLRALWEEAVAAEPDPRFRVGAMGRAYFAETDPKVLCAELWIQALTEASDDAEIRKFLRKQMREVHDFVTDVIRRSQAEGGILDDRDASAEAWIFISIGLLGTVSRRVGNLLEDDFEAIIASRRKWMTGT